MQHLQGRAAVYPLSAIAGSPAPSSVFRRRRPGGRVRRLRSRDAVVGRRAANRRTVAGVFAIGASRRRSSRPPYRPLDNEAYLRGRNMHRSDILAGRRRDLSSPDREPSGPPLFLERCATIEARNRLQATDYDADFAPYGGAPFRSRLCGLDVAGTRVTAVRDQGGVARGRLRRRLHLG